MAKTNTDARWLPGADMEQSASRIRDILLALSGMLQNHSADEVRGLIQSIVDLMTDDNDKSIGQQLTNAIENKASNADLNNAIQALTNSITSVDNEKVNKTDFSTYSTTTANTISTIQSNVAAHSNNLSSISNELNDVNSAITKLENRENRKLVCLNGYTRFNGGQAISLVNKLSSCLLFAERDCPNGLLVTNPQNVSIAGTDDTGAIIPLYAEHLYVFSHISHSDSGDELRLAADIPINTDGRHWLSGSEISHTENSKEYAVEGKLGDMYLNIESLCIYRCVGSSKNNLYEWEYIGQWLKTSDIKLSNLSAELQNTISNKAEKTVVDELSKNVQSLISRPSGGTGGGSSIVDTALNTQSSNAISNMAVAREFDVANDERNGLAYALGSLIGVERVPQLYIDDSDDEQIRLFNTERVASKMDLMPQISLESTVFISVDGERFKYGSQSFDIYPDYEEWDVGIYDISLSISKNGDMGMSLRLSDTSYDVSDTTPENLIGRCNPDTGNCTIQIGWVQIDHTDEGWGIASYNFYNISGAVFLSDLAVSKLIGNLSSLATTDKSSLVNAVNETNSKAVMAAETAESKLNAVFVKELPTSSINYTFETDTAFTAIERCTTTITTDDTDKYLTVTSASNAGNKYGLAQLDFSSISANASSVVIEMDFRMPGGRWYVGFADLSKRPGTSHTMTYDDAGVVFHYGTKDGSKFYINGVPKNTINFVDTWLKCKVIIDVISKSVYYEIKDRSTGNLVLSDTSDFVDYDTTQITGIELYTWTQTSIDIDNVRVSANVDVNDKTLYLVENNKSYNMYLYKNNEPQLVANSSVAKNYSETPQRIGTWIDGTPVWKVAFKKNFTEQEILNNGVEIYTILSSSVQDVTAPFIVNSYINVFLENTPCVVDDLSCEINSAVISCNRAGVTLGTEGGIYGWIEFVTPESNLKIQA